MASLCHTIATARLSVMFLFDLVGVLLCIHQADTLLCYLGRPEGYMLQRVSRITKLVRLVSDSEGHVKKSTEMGNGQEDPDLPSTPS